MAQSQNTVILVVEDDDQLRELYAELLSRAGYSVIETANGREALEAMDSLGAPSLILLDMMMPVLDGAGFIQELERRPCARSIPVIAVTATPEQVPQAAIVQDVLSKPASFNRLLRVVKEHCAAA